MKVHFCLINKSSSDDFVRSKTGDCSHVLSKTYLKNLHKFVFYLLLLISPLLNAGAGTIGVNGAACTYFTFADAISAASSGDTIYISGSSYPNFLGNIDKDLTFVPGEAASPDFTGCEQENLDADSVTVIIDVNGSSHDDFGGMGKISNGATVTFRHMWLRNASAENGGILAVIESSNLILDDVLINQGVASISGGNIYVSSDTEQPSTLSLVNDTLLYLGQSVDGGGIALYNSSITVDDGDIVANNADNNGGGIYANNSDINLTSSLATVVANESGNYGGGIFAQNTNINTTDAMVSNNNAIFSGGGMYLSGSTLNFTGGVLDSNSATSFATNEGGGAVYIVSGTALFQGSQLTNNSSANSGGAIKAQQNTVINVADGTLISGNTTSGNGGGISVLGQITVDNGIITNNISNNSGGGIRCFSCSAINILNGSVISENQAYLGGGISVFSSNTDVLISNSNILGNSVDGYGGGISREGGIGSMDIVNSVIASNLASLSGAGLLIKDSGVIVSITNSQILANSVTSVNAGVGGGIAMEDATGSLDIVDSVIDMNSASISGGGIYTDDNGGTPLSSVTLQNVALTGNITTNSSDNSEGGAAAYFTNVDSVLITETLFEGNSSTNSAGGVFFRFLNEVFVSNSVFSNNSSAIGAGITSQNSNVVINDTSFTLNQAMLSGGAIYDFSGLMNLNKVKLNSNQASFGGAIHSILTSLNIVNSLFNNNLATISGGGIFSVNSDLFFSSLIGNGTAQCNSSTLPANQYCSSMMNNSAAQQGGAIMIKNFTPKTVNISGVALIANTAATNGTAIYVEDGATSVVNLNNLLVAENGTDIDVSSTIEQVGLSTMVLDSVTLAGNKDTALLVTDIDVDVEMYNSIIYDNTIGPHVAFGISFLRNCNNSQSVNGSSQSMGGNLGNPSFVSTARGSYRLAANSTSRDQCNTGPSQDLDGFLRPDNGGSYDQGAFEFGSTLIDIIFSNDFE